MDLNIWFLSLPEGRQKALREDKWALAQAAMNAGIEAERERIAKWLEVQRNEIPATGIEFANTLRSKYGDA